MTYSLPPLNAVRAFEAAARHLSFRLAADELAVTPSALSHQIRLLEDYLGVKLFVRMNRAVALSPAGEMIAPRIGEGFAQIDAAFALIRPRPDDNTLVVSTGPAFSAKWLAPRLHYFIEHYPEIDFRLSANLKLTDFVADGVDAAVRFGSGNYSGLFVEAMFDEIILPLISPSLFAAAGGRADESLFSYARLLHDDSIRFLEGARGWEDWLQVMGYDQTPAERGSRFSHADHVIDAAIDGGGIALGRLSLATRDLIAGRLAAPFDLALQAVGGFYFCCPEEKLQREVVLHFLAWLRDEAAAQTDQTQQLLVGKTIA